MRGAPPVAREAHCTSCHALVLWATTELDKPIPINRIPRVDGNIVLRRDARGVLRAHFVNVGQPSLFDEDRYVSHFATCPHADAHRKR